MKSTTCLASSAIHRDGSWYLWYPSAGGRSRPQVLYIFIVPSVNCIQMSDSTAGRYAAPSPRLESVSQGKVVADVPLIGFGGCSVSVQPIWSADREALSWAVAAHKGWCATRSGRRLTRVMLFRTSSRCRLDGGWSVYSAVVRMNPVEIVSIDHESAPRRSIIRMQTHFIS